MLVNVLFNSYIFSSVLATEEFMHKLIGAGLLYSGISDLFSAIYLSGKLRTYLRKKNFDIENKRINEDAKKIDPVEQKQDYTEPESTMLNDENNVINNEKPAVNEEKEAIEE